MRWDVTVAVTSTYIVAVEADEPLRAQEQAMALTGDAVPNRVDIDIEIEQGVR